MDQLDDTQPGRERSRTRRIAGLVAILASLTFGAILIAPAVTNLERTVATGDAAAAVPGGSVVFSERVARTELRVGDLVTVRLPGSTGSPVTREITAVLPNAGSPLFQVAGEKATWLSLSDPTQLRATAALPGVGYLVQAAATPAVRIFLIFLPFAFLALALIRPERPRTRLEDASMPGRMAPANGMALPPASR